MLRAKKSWNIKMRVTSNLHGPSQDYENHNMQCNFLIINSFC